MSQETSYTEEDIKNIEKYMEKNPKVRTWHTKDGLVIPIPLIKDDHLKNIRKYIKKFDKHFSPKVYELIDKEFKKRFLNTTAGEVLFGDN